MNESKGKGRVKRINKESDLSELSRYNPIEVYREGSREIFGEPEYREGLFLRKDDNKFCVLRIALNGLVLNQGELAIEIAKYIFDSEDDEGAILYDIEGPFEKGSIMFTQYQDALERLGTKL